MHPEKVEKWSAIFARCLRWMSHELEKKAISSDIQSDINSFVIDIEKEVKGLIPYGLKIKWETETTREAFIKANDVVVVLSPYENQAKNFIHAVVQYISKSTMPRITQYIDPKLMRAIQLTVARKIFVSKKQELLNDFNTQILESETKDHDIKYYIQTLMKLDDIGYFTRLFMYELQLLADVLYPRVADDNIKQEINRLFNFMLEIAERKPDEEIETIIQTRHINFGLVFVADTAKFAKYGDEPYVSYILGRRTKDNIKRFYLLSAGKTHNTFSKSITKKLTECMKVARVGFKYEYEGKNTEGRTIPFMITMLEVL